MTGRELRTLREYIGVDPFAWAALLGVHASTVYRWESSAAEVRMDPLQLKILRALAETVVKSDSAAAQIKVAINEGLWRGGTLRALLGVLEIVVPARDIVTDA